MALMVTARDDMTIPLRTRDHLDALMRSAIEAARRADQPFGCVVARLETGENLLSAGNSSGNDPTGHAEMNALRGLPKLKIEPSELILISTAEPCPMCAAAAWWSGVRGVVFGTSIDSLSKFGWRQILIPAIDLIAKAKPPASLFFRGGFLKDETDPLYQHGPRPHGTGP